VYVQVVQSDGGEAAAAINCATLALMHAGIYMRDFVVACTAGVIDGTVVLGACVCACVVGLAGKLCGDRVVCGLCSVAICLLVQSAPLNLDPTRRQ
jgi:hypothetical protein